MSSARYPLGGAHGEEHISSIQFSRLLSPLTYVIRLARLRDFLAYLIDNTVVNQLLSESFERSRNSFRALVIEIE